MSNDWDGQQGQQGQPGWGQGPQQGPGQQGPGQQGWNQPGHQGQQGQQPQQGWNQPGQQGPGQQGQQGWGPQAQPTQYGGFQGQPGGYGQPPQPPKNKKKVGLIAMVLVLVAGLATAGALVFVNRSDDGSVAEEATYVIMDEPAVSTQPVFESRDARGDDPFFPLETQLVAFQEERMAAFQADDGGDGGDGASGGGDDGGDGTNSSSSDAPDFDVAALEADVKTGLYGGTAENTCDPERLISFLIENPDLGEAWAQVQGITFAEIPTYIRGLTIRVLAEPVAVLNHGYNSTTKTAYEIDTVLDAGTAVLVDQNGDIRTRCYCGNPITPKPPTGHKPPACLIFPASVWVEPGSTERRIGVPQTVFLTNRTAQADTGIYVEVMWGTSPLEMGWTPKNNASINRYCRPIRETPKCPTGTDTPIYRTPTAETPFGQVGTSTLTTFEGTSVLRAQIRPVGGSGDRVVTNGRVLVYFGHPFRAANSGWVNLSDINENSSPEDCQPIRVCIEFLGATLPGDGGPVPGVGPGFHRVEITGNIVLLGLEETGFAEDASVEVRLLEHGNQTAWIHESEVVQTAPDSACEPGPIYLCMSGINEPFENLLLRDPTANPFAEFEEIDFETATPAELMAAADRLETTDLTNIAGFAANVDVTLIGSPTPTNGMVQVQVAGTGPIGWVPVSTLDGDACVPEPVCIQLIAPVYTNYKNAGSVVPGTPMGAPMMVDIWTSVAIEWPAGVMTISDLAMAPAALDDVHILIGLNGTRGWAPFSAFNLESGFTNCEPEQPECPTANVVPAVAESPGRTCCISGPNGWELVSFTGRTRSGQTGIEYEVSPASGANFWFSTASTIAVEGSPCDSVPIAMCPTTPNGTSQIAATVPDVCCVAMEDEGGLTFVEMTVTGEQAELGGQTLVAVDESNNPIPMDQFVDANLCDLDPDPECEEGRALIQGECCEAGQEVVAGQCTDPCPANEPRQADGTCGTNTTTPPTPRPDCRANQERLADGTCRDRPPTCPSGQELVNGTCRDEAPACPAGTTQQTDGTCLTDEPTCPPNFTYQGDDICCPNGTERLGSTSNCATPCAADETRGDDGTCRTPAQNCPQGQLTLLLECCPNTQEPNGYGQCVLPCPTGSFRNTADGTCVSNCVSGVFDSQGVCCQAGQVLDTGSGLCTTPPSCPSGVIAPSDGECCPVGEGIDLGGYCDQGCPTSQQTSSGCCFDGEVPNSNRTDCEPATPVCPSDSDWAPVSQACCPVRNPQTPAEIIGGSCEYFA